MEPPPGLRQALLPGEAIRWHGRPHPAKGIGWSVFISLFGILLALLIAEPSPEGTITINGVPTDDPAQRKAAWLVVLTIAIAMSLALPLQVLWALRTIYPVTDRRALILVRMGMLGGLHSVLPWRIWGTERPDKPSMDAVGQLLILRPRPRAGTSQSLAVFYAIRDDIGAQAAINALVAVPRAFIDDQPAPVAPPEALAASLFASLRPGERLLWAAQPDRARFALASLIRVVVFLLVIGPVPVVILSPIGLGALVLLLIAFILAWPLLAWIRAPHIILQDRRRDRGGETTWPLTAIESIKRTPPTAPFGSLALQDGRQLDEEDRPATLLLRALPDVAAAEAALFMALDGLRRPGSLPLSPQPWRKQ